MKPTLPFLFVLFLLAGVSGCRVQNNPPELTSLSPKEAEVGKEVTLTGYQFGASPVVTVGAGTSAVTAKVNSQDDNSIRITIPLVAPGITQIRVQTDEGTSDPLPLKVRQPLPTLEALTPTNGLPGSSVVITGNYLNQLQRVRFNDIDAVVKDSSAQKLTVLVPANAPRGPVAILVQTLGGQLQYPFIVAGTPQITTITPRVAKPGTELVIQGTNLLDGIVRINGRFTERQLTTVKDTEIRTIIPAEATSGFVTVTVFDKLVATSADTIKIVQKPAIASLNVREGISDDKLILTGFNLRDVTGVTFGNAVATFRAISDTQIEAIVPSLQSAGPVTVSVSSVGGNASAGDSFFYYLPPANVTVSPARQLRGQPITISGQNLHRITDVRVSGQSVPITSRTEGSELLVNVPLNGVSGPVTVINRAGAATSARPLIVVQKPVVTDITPKKAKAGERVVLRGDFLLNAQIFFTGTTVPAIDAGKNEDTERWVLVPNEAQTGTLRVVNASPDQTVTEPFTVLRLASNLDFTPKAAKAGDEITVTGQNLTSVTEVRFSNGASAPAKFTVDGFTLKVTVPAGAVTGQVCVTNEAGTICSSGSFTIAK